MHQPTIFSAAAPSPEEKNNQVKTKKQTTKKQTTKKQTTKKQTTKKQKKQKAKGVITVTLGDSGENHVGNQQIGRMVEEGEGFTYADFVQAKANAEKLGLTAEIIDLRILLSEEDKARAAAQNKTIPPAYIIIIRDSISEDEADAIYTELTSFEWDTKYFDTRRQRVLNKHARSNLCFDKYNQKADYENGKGTIISWDRLPKLSKAKLLISKIFGKKAKTLIGEGNQYNDRTKNGIGFHGDAERRKIIALRLNERDENNDPGTMKMCWSWFHKYQPVGRKLTKEIGHGWVYAMCEVAGGTNWKRGSQYTLRHAAGGDKYTKLKTEK